MTIRLAAVILLLVMLVSAVAADHLGELLSPVAVGADERGLYIDPDSGDLWAGRMQGFRLTPDFRLRNAPDNTVSTKLWVRSIYIGDIGDPSDLALRRAGPDNGHRYTSTPQPVDPGSNVGTIYWQACGTGGITDNEDHEDCFEPALGRGRLAQLYVRTVDSMTATNRAGNLYLATTPHGTIDPIDRLVIGHDGDFFLWSPRHRALRKVLFTDCGDYLCLAVAR